MTETKQLEVQKKTFHAKTRRFTIVYKPHKSDRDGNVIQDPVHLEFVDGYFTTNDPDIIEFLLKRPSCGVGKDFWEVKERPNEIPRGQYAPKVARMGDDPQDGKIEQVMGMMEKLGSAVLTVTDQLKTVTERLDTMEEAKEEEPPKKKQTSKTIIKKK